MCMHTRVTCTYLHVYAYTRHMCIPTCVCIQVSSMDAAAVSRMSFKKVYHMYTMDAAAVSGTSFDKVYQMIRLPVHHHKP